MLWNLHELMPCMTICGWLVFQHLLCNCTLISLRTKLVLVPDLSGAVSSCWVPGYIVVVLCELTIMSRQLQVQVGQVSSNKEHFATSLFNEGFFCHYSQ